MDRSKLLVVPLLLALAGPVLARDATKELQVSLKLAPQESVASDSPDLLPGALARTLQVRVEDGRGSQEPLKIGQGTDGDEIAFPIHASSDVVAFIQEAVTQIASAWGVKTSQPADAVLVVSVTRYFVDESNKALGSMYAAEVKLAFTLKDGAGAKLVEGAASGSAHRYGRARSSDNCNEVLSDALKEALANVLSSSELQAAWASGKASASAQTAKSVSKEPVEERLRKLDELLKKGLITKEEHATKRAEILKEL